MVSCKVITSDSVVWNKIEVIAKLTEAAITNEQITLDLIGEGPDFHELDIFHFILGLRKQYNYDLKNITVITRNTVEQTSTSIKKVISFPYTFVQSTQHSLQGKSTQKNLTHTFGIFIGRSNLHRLDLSAYLYNKYRDKTMQTFHYDKNSDYHKSNLGLDNLISTGVSAAEVGTFVDSCPIKLDHVTYPILLDQHCEIWPHYQSFFVEIVCETFYSGHTFFPTEKTWRSIALGTPFIVQGPQYFLRKLHDMGFKTFEHWWDEGYSVDPPDYQCLGIKNVIDYLGTRNNNELAQMYQEMQPILEHNKNLFFSLTEDNI